MVKLSEWEKLLLRLLFEIVLLDAIVTMLATSYCDIRAAQMLTLMDQQKWSND